MFYGRIYLNLLLLLLSVNSVFRLELMYISLIRKYQVKPHSSPWFSAACAVAIVHRNHFFVCSKRKNLILKFRPASNCWKKVLEAAKLAYANKTKESITFQKLVSQDFWWIANSVLKEGKSAYLVCSMTRRCCLLHLIKQNCLLKIFVRTLILMTQVSFYLFSFL